MKEESVKNKKSVFESSRPLSTCQSQKSLFLRFYLQCYRIEYFLFILIIKLRVRKRRGPGTGDSREQQAAHNELVAPNHGVPRVVLVLVARLWHGHAHLIQYNRHDGQEEVWGRLNSRLFCRPCINAPGFETTLFIVATSDFSALYFEL